MAQNRRTVLFLVWKLFCVLTMLQRRVAFEFFLMLWQKMVELDFGGLLEESTLIYLNIIQIWINIVNF